MTMPVGRKTSLCYLERDGRYLVLHRTKKEHDENGGKKGLSAFSLRVYRERLDIPRGTTVSYGELARRFGIIRQSMQNPCRCVRAYDRRSSAVGSRREARGK